MSPYAKSILFHMGFWFPKILFLFQDEFLAVNMKSHPERIDKIGLDIIIVLVCTFLFFLVLQLLFGLAAGWHGWAIVVAIYVVAGVCFDLVYHRVKFQHMLGYTSKTAQRAR